MVHSDEQVVALLLRDAPSAWGVLAAPWRRRRLSLRGGATAGCRGEVGEGLGVARAERARLGLFLRSKENQAWA